MAANRFHSLELEVRARFMGLRDDKAEVAFQRMIVTPAGFCKRPMIDRSAHRT